MPRQNIRECYSRRAWRRYHQHTLWGLQRPPKELDPWLTHRPEPDSHFISPQTPVMCLTVLRVRSSSTGQGTPLALVMPNMVRKETRPTLQVPQRSENKSSFCLVSELPRNLGRRRRLIKTLPHPVTALRAERGDCPSEA